MVRSLVFMQISTPSLRTFWKWPSGHKKTGYTTLAREILKVAFRSKKDRIHTTLAREILKASGQKKWPDTPHYLRTFWKWHSGHKKGPDTPHYLRTFWKWPSGKKKGYTWLHAQGKKSLGPVPAFFEPQRVLNNEFFFLFLKNGWIATQYSEKKREKIASRRQIYFFKLYRVRRNVALSSPQGFGEGGSWESRREGGISSTGWFKYIFYRVV